MPLTGTNRQEFDAAADRLKNFYEGQRPYDPVDNPGGFRRGGNVVNFPPALQDVAEVGAGISALAGDVSQAAIVAAEKAAAADVASGRAQAAADRADATVDGKADKAFLQAGTGAVARTLDAEVRQRLTAAQFGAASNASARAEDAMLRAFNEGRRFGRRLDISAGSYLLSGLTLNYGDGSGNVIVDKRGVPVCGEGKQNTTIISAAANAYAMTIAGPAVSYSGVSDLTFRGGPLLSSGLNVKSIAFLDNSNLNFEDLEVGMRLESVLSSTFTKNIFVGNKVGVVALKGAGFSDCNANKWVACHWRLNTQLAYSGGPHSGAWFTPATIEGNGTHGDLATGGFDMTFTGAEGGAGLNMDGGYIENNAGGFDLSLTNNGPERVVHVLQNVYFGRIKASRFVKNNIKSRGKNTIVLIGCTFEGKGDYVPDASRLYIDKDANTTVICIGCKFGSALEQGDLRNLEDDLAALILRMLGVERKQVQVFSGNSGPTSIPAGATRYISQGLVGTNQSLVYVPAGRRLRFKNLRVYTAGAPGTDQSYIFTLQKLFTDTALTCTVSGNGSNSALDLTNSVVFEGSERWCIKVVSSAGAAAMANVIFSMEAEIID